jgi:hypothetical protein
MTSQGHIQKPPTGPRAIGLSLLALAVASLIAFGAILPAEYGIDPLGIGRLTGVGRLAGQGEVAFQPVTGEAGAPLAHSYPVPFRTDTVEIPLQSAFGPPFANEIEYKVRMAADATLVYAWSAAPVEMPDEFYYDFHGHTLEEGEARTVATYEQASAPSANGALTAPFDGVHGWYFSNLGAKPVVVRLELSGFYELVPPGETGNLGGILANLPADQAVAK